MKSFERRIEERVDFVVYYGSTYYDPSVFGPPDVMVRTFYSILPLEWKEVF